MVDVSGDMDDYFKLRESIWEKRWELWEMVGYKPHHPAVRAFHDSRARVKVGAGPRRSSKSYSAAFDFLPLLLVPGATVWIVGPNYSLAEKEFRYIYDTMIVKGRKSGLFPAPKRSSNSVKSGNLRVEWEYEKGVPTILECKSAENPASLLGEAVDGIIYSEGSQLSRAIREQYTAPTVITRRGTEIIPTTPSEAGEWVLELFEIGKTPNELGIESFHWDVTANPTYDPAEKERAKKFYGVNSPVYREQYLGEFVFYAGRVYPMFDANLHLIQPFEIPKWWPIIRAVDFGAQDPFVCLWIAVGPCGELYVIDEMYVKETRGIRDLAREIKNRSMGMNITLTVGDPSAKQSIKDMNMEGIPMIPANRDRMSGRLLVTEYMTPNDNGIRPFPFHGPMERSTWPRLYIFSKCHNLGRELKFYRWKERGKSSRVAESTIGDDHAVDALRYGVMTRPSPRISPQPIPTGSHAEYERRCKKYEQNRRSIGAYIG